jgi:hypothetical protein
MSQDPSGFIGGDANLYRYVANDPIQGADPTGLHIVVPKPQDLGDLIIRLRTGNGTIRGLGLEVGQYRRLDGKTIIAIVWPKEIQECQDDKLREKLKAKYIQQIVDKNKNWISEKWIRMIFAASGSMSTHIGVGNAPGAGISALFPYPTDPTQQPIEFLDGEWDITIAVDNTKPVGIGHAWITYTNRATGVEYTVEKALGSFLLERTAGRSSHTITASRVATVINPRIYRFSDPSCTGYAVLVWYLTTYEDLSGSTSYTMSYSNGIWMWIPIHPGWLQTQIYWINGGYNYGHVPGYTLPPSPIK